MAETGTAVPGEGWVADVRTLPDAYGTLTLDEIDAAIATFCDPLTADEVVALAQWWTLRALLVSVANETPDEELGLMAAVGQIRQALRLAFSRDTDEKQWAGCLMIYQSNPACTEAYHRLHTLLTNPELNDSTRRTRLLALLRAELAVGRFEAAYSVMRQLSWHIDAALAGEIVLSMIHAQELDAADDLLLMWIALTQDLGNWRHICQLMYQMTQTPAPDFCRTVLAQLEKAFRQRSSRPPIQPDHVDYREAYLAGMWLGLANLHLGDLAAAGRWLRDCDIVDPKAYADTFVVACEIGSAQCHDTQIIYTLARSLMRRNVNHVGIVYLIRRLIQLNKPDLARDLLPKIKIMPETLIPLVAAYDQLGDSAAGDALLRERLPRLLKEEKPTAAAQREHFTAQLIQIGRLVSALRVLGDATRIHRYRVLLATTVFDHAPTPQMVTQMIEQVEQWWQEPPPAEANSKWHEDRQSFLFHCARTLRPHEPEQARAWVKRIEDWLLEPVFTASQLRFHLGSAQRDGLRLRLILFYDALDDPESAYRWLQMLEHIAENPIELYRFMRANLHRRRTAFVRHCLAIVQAKRPRLKHMILQREVQPLFRSGIEHYGQMAHMGEIQDVTKLPKYRLHDPTTIAQEWHKLPRLPVYDHLTLLAHTYPALHAIAPDLYPRVVRACLQLMANFEPHWTAAMQALLDEAH
jgi:hypothetical protein